MIPAGFLVSTKLIPKNQILAYRLTSTIKKTSLAPEPSTSQSFPQAPDPLSCCGSGCANCVWIQYADDVSEYFTKKEHNSKAHKILDKYKVIKEEMEKHVEDDNLKAYLLMEIKLKFGKNK